MYEDNVMPANTGCVESISAKTTTAEGAEAQETPMLTQGQTLVGFNFNPSGDEKVVKIKAFCADLIDFLGSVNSDKESFSRIREKFLNEAITKIIDAQMWAVKAVTFTD
jgi:hypothetical protein